MARTRRQDGQALVGVLVVMTLVFAFAGGLAVAASSLMRSQDSAFKPYVNDLAVRNTIAAAIAQSAGASNCQNRATPPRALATYGVPACQAAIAVGVNPAHVIPFTGQGCGGGASCDSIPVSAFLSAGQPRGWLWFTTRGQAVAWVSDGDNDQGGGNNKNNCKAPTLPGGGGTAYLPSALVGGIRITQVALQLNAATQAGMTVCFQVDTGFPFGVRYDDDQNEAASQRVFNLVVPVGPGALEEVDLWQSATTARLQWEEGL